MERSTALRGLTYAQLCRPDWYAGHVASVLRLGQHRMLQLREASREGCPLAVWVSSVAMEAAGSSDWAPLLDVQPLPALSVRLRGRFVRHDAADRLTADIHFPEDIAISRCNPLAAG